MPTGWLGMEAPGGRFPTEKPCIQGEKDTMSMTKTEIIDELASDVGCDKKLCAALLHSLAEIVKEGLARDGEFTIPGITKLKAKETPARKTRMGVNPFTKEPMVFKSKPAGVKVRALPVKNIKDIFAR